ncbi:MULTISPECIES: tetratricopeptide repeat protein [unclassified Kribbella]|uniref:tetratricopeptide repeat protein n=1 Tax=unclassified Kribbella TaxID=2644121 RepID=UPI0030198C66
MNQELVDRLQRAESAPYGKARSALLEDVVRRADAAGEDDLAFYSRLALVTAYVMGGEPRKSLVPFARCVADWDAEPGKYQEYSHLFHWCFKYAPSTLTKFPEVPLDRAYAVLDDMERRWRLSGHSMHAVHQHRWLVAHHIGDAEAAAEQFRLWSTAPRDDLSDCVGCDPTSKVHHLTTVGRTADAVALAVSVLDGQLTCNEQPQQMLTALLPAYVAEGMYSEAVDAHRKGYRLLRSRVGELSEHADHVVFLARTGNELKAVELIERHLTEFDDPPSPYAEMTFAAAAAHALGRVDGLTIRLPKAEAVPAAELSELLAGRALELAAQFDARNGTKHRSEEIQAMLTAEPWVEYLPLSETARRAQVRKQTPLPVEPVADEQPVPSGRGWLDRAEEAWQGARPEEAAAAWQAFEQEVPESEWTAVDRARVLDGRGLVAHDQPEVALEAWREALALYAEAGEEVRVLRDRGRIGRLLCESGQIDEGLATAEEPVRWLIANDEPRRRGHWQYSLAAMYTQADRPDDAVRELAELRERSDIDDDLRAGAALMQGDLLARMGRFEEAEEASTVAVGVATDLIRSFAYKQRGRIRLELERPAEAAEDLAEAVADIAGAPGLQVPLALCQLELSRAYLLSGRPLEAAETGEEALPVLGSSADFADPLADLRGVLIDAYKALGELESALTKVHELLGSAPADAHPAWLGMVRQDEGLLLEQLNRDEDAIEAFLAAASYLETAEQPVEQVQAIRLAAQSARYAGDFGQAVELVERTRPILDALPSADPRVLFQTAGTHWDLALIALQQGQTDTAVQQAEQAADHYARGGYDDQHTNARLLVAEHGTTDSTLLEEIFPTLPTGHDLWYRAGWLLVDRLRTQGRTQEATTLEARLSE